MKKRDDKKNIKKSALKFYNLKCTSVIFRLFLVKAVSVGHSTFENLSKEKRSYSQTTLNNYSFFKFKKKICNKIKKTRQQKILQL